MNWEQLFTQLGVLGGLVVFFSWAGWQRETKLLARVDELERFVRTTLIELVSSTNEHIKSNSDINRKNTESVTELVRILATRPCFQDMDRLNESVHRLLSRTEALNNHLNNG